jgi:hypothetical protein
LAEFGGIFLWSGLGCWAKQDLSEQAGSGSVLLKYTNQSVTYIFTDKILSAWCLNLLSLLQQAWMYKFYCNNEWYFQKIVKSGFFFIEMGTYKLPLLDPDPDLLVKFRTRIQQKDPDPTGIGSI